MRPSPRLLSACCGLENEARPYFDRVQQSGLAGWPLADLFLVVWAGLGSASEPLLGPQRGLARPRHTHLIKVVGP